MDVQKIVAFVLVAVVLVYGLWLTYRAFNSKGKGGCNCGGCK